MAEDKDAAPKKEARESTPVVLPASILREQEQRLGDGESFYARIMGRPLFFLFKLFLGAGVGCLGAGFLWWGASILLDWEKAYEADGLLNIPLVLFCFMFGYYLVRDIWRSVTDPDFWRH